MSRTYKATGINLKGMPLGESDRLLTVLTQEVGLIRAVAPGARKHHSKIGARSGLFVVNQLLMIEGKTLDKIIQAETIESYPGISQDLCKLTASQYLAELVLHQALSDQPQEELFWLLCDHLGQIERSPQPLVLVCLVQGIFHLLTLAGLAPQVHACCITQETIDPDFSHLDPQVGFSVTAGGVICLAELERLEAERRRPRRSPFLDRYSAQPVVSRPAIAAEPKPDLYHTISHPQRLDGLNTRLTAGELFCLQQVAHPEFVPTDSPQLLEETGRPFCYADWLTVERLLRHYVQYHFERPIRSAALVETCFTALPSAEEPLSPAPG